MTNEQDDTFNAGTGSVNVNLPDGSTVTRSGNMTLAQLDEIAAGKGIVRYYVKDSNGETVKPSDFPMSNCTIVVSEKNEAKV